MWASELGFHRWAHAIRIDRLTSKHSSYLCGYIYYKSLDHNADRTIFVHVPPIDKPFTTEATTQALLHTIEKCVAQIR